MLNYKNVLQVYDALCGFLLSCIKYQQRSENLCLQEKFKQMDKFLNYLCMKSCNDDKSYNYNSHVL